MVLLRITSRSGIWHVIRTRSQRRKRDDCHPSRRLHTQTHENGLACGRALRPQSILYIPQSHAPSDRLGESASPCGNGARLGEHEGPSEQELHAQPSCALLVYGVPTWRGMDWRYCPAPGFHVTGRPAPRAGRPVRSSKQRDGWPEAGDGLKAHGTWASRSVLPRNPTRATLLPTLHPIPVSPSPLGSFDGNERMNPCIGARHGSLGNCGSLPSMSRPGRAVSAIRMGTRACVMVYISHPISSLPASETFSRLCSALPPLIVARQHSYWIYKGSIKPATHTQEDSSRLLARKRRAPAVVDSFTHSHPTVPSRASRPRPRLVFVSTRSGLRTSVNRTSPSGRTTPRRPAQANRRSRTQGPDSTSAAVACSLQPGLRDLYITPSTPPSPSQWPRLFTLPSPAYALLCCNRS